MLNAAQSAQKLKVRFEEITIDAPPTSNTGTSSADATPEATRHGTVHADLQARVTSRSTDAAGAALQARFSRMPETPGLQGTLDQKMAATHQQFLAIFRQEVGPEVFAHAQPVLAMMNDPAVSFDARRQAVETYVRQFKETRPQAILDLVKMVDCQLLVYGVAEDRAKLADAPHALAIPDSVRALAAQCNNDPEAIRRELADMTVTSVLTAHPTTLHEPKSVMNLHQAARNLSDPAALRETCIQLWRDSGVRGQRPSVQAEAESNVPHLRRMQREIRRIHKKIDQNIENHAGPVLISPLVQADSWIGGDRDGNFNVDADAMKGIMGLQAEVALQRYQDKLGSGRLGKDDSLRSLLDTHAPGEAGKILKRLDATRQEFSNTVASPRKNRPLSYRSPQELIDDLVSLRGTIPSGPAQNKLSRFIREVQGAGFHMAAVDVRQNSASHQATVADLLHGANIVSNYAELPEQAKQKVLWDRLTAPGDKPLYASDKPYSSQTVKEMAIFQAISDIHARYGQSAMPNYIIANTESVSDLLEPMVLLREVGLAGSNGLKMKIVPLIETVPDLQNGRTIVGDLLSHPHYKAWLQQGDNTQQVMVGYSDSNRLDGPMASNWEIHKALHYLQEIAGGHGVKLLVFHGRGGTTARGAGADVRQEVAMLPGGAAANGYRCTDQGETIAMKFGSQEAAEHNLTNMAAATIAAKTPDKLIEDPAYHGVMDVMSKRSAETYRDLVFETPAFIDYYNQATPVGYTPHLNAGSRASSRVNLVDQQVNLNQLRAIPWVAGWNQSRAMVPAWYGMGTALTEHVQSGANQAVDETMVAQLQTMYRHWPFFTHFIDRTEGELAKVDLGIAKQYSGLVRDTTVGW